MPVTRPNLGLTSGFLARQDGWSSAMNDNLDKIDAAAPVNVTAYATVAAAIAACPAGGRLYFPAEGGPYIPPDANGWAITKPITIYGDKASLINGTEGTVFRPFGTAGSTQNSTVFTIDSDRVHMHDFHISPTAAPSADGTGDGIRVINATIPRDRITLERVRIWFMGRYGFHCKPTVATQVFVRLVECDFNENRQGGVACENTTGFVADHCYMSTNLSYGMWLVGIASPLITACYFENNQPVGSSVFHAFLRMDTVRNAVVEACSFENFHTAGVGSRVALTLNNCLGCSVSGNHFLNASSVASTRSILLIGTALSNWIGPNQHRKVAETVVVWPANDCEGNVVFPQHVSEADATVPGKVTMSTGARNFALLNDLTAGLADNKGVGILLPSHPDHTAIDASAVQNGLLVYNSTTNKLMIRANGAWVVVGTQTA